MTGERAVLYSFALYCISVLLPIIPASVIFKLFPDTKVTVTGPLQNLTMKTTGAFGAYVVTAALGFVLIQNVVHQIELMSSSTWTLDVPVQLVDANDHLIQQRAVVDFVNSDPKHVRPGPERTYVTLPHSEAVGWPVLYFGLQGFANGMLDVQQIIDSNDSNVAAIDTSQRRISVKQPVKLTQLGRGFTTDEYTGGMPLKQDEGGPGPK